MYNTIIMNAKSITNEDIMNILIEIQKTSNEDREETKNEFRKIDKNIEDIKNQAEDKDERDKVRMNRMNERMDKFESAMEDNIERAKEIEILKKNQTKMREILRKEQEERVQKFKKDTGMITDKEIKDKNTNNKADDSKNKDTNNESIEDLMNKTNDSFRQTGLGNYQDSLP